MNHRGEGWRMFNGDCLDIMPKWPEDRFHAIVTDPPYGLNFMGKEWDRGVPGVPFWEAALRVLKPGGYLLSFGGTRTFHRIAVAIEDAGFEIRDCLSWLYGSGFPKSQNVSKAIDKAAGVEREVVGVDPARSGRLVNQKKTYVTDSGWSAGNRSADITAPATSEAEQWDGWGTALKPAWEPIILARKPFKQTVVKNVLAHGTGALNIDGCRIGTESVGRWPANVALDPDAAAMLDQQNGASRFFYIAKASKQERGAGNNHPTVKPIELMRWLVRLVTPPGGIILDPFTGSGSTGVAALMEGFRFVGIELDKEYTDIASSRIEDVL